MTIDEAIAYAREKAKYKKTKYDKCPTRMRYCCEMCFHKPKCNEVAEEHEQLAEWLEELVMLRLDSCMIHMPERLQLVENGYNKALNDFVNACEKRFDTMYGQRYVDMRDIVSIAEQLKEGAKNDD